MNIFKNRDIEEIYGVNDVIFSKDDISKSLQESPQKNQPASESNATTVQKKLIPNSASSAKWEVIDQSAENSIEKSKKYLNKSAISTIKTVEEKKLLMDAVLSEASACTACELNKSRNSVVLGEGTLDAKLMFIGEAPGENEDAQGRPFVGKAGILLTKMIEAMGLTREQIYIANVAKCRPPNNRNPFEDEALTCIHFLFRQIAIVNPDVIVTLGSVATRYLLSVSDNISHIRGKWQTLNGYDVMPSYHPAYLLRSPNKKKEAWSDLQEVMKRLGI